MIAAAAGRVVAEREAVSAAGGTAVDAYDVFAADRNPLIESVCLDIHIVAVIVVTAVGTRYKVRHRAEFGISVSQAYWGLGIGTALTEACIVCAGAAGYAQPELTVVADNRRAVALYEKDRLCGVRAESKRLLLACRRLSGSDLYAAGTVSSCRWVKGHFCSKEWIPWALKRSTPRNAPYTIAVILNTILRQMSGVWKTPRWGVFSRKD